ncbi:MAG: hypothetical protein ABI960_06635 [Candidatus Eisenbacteria bacterium]
MIPLVPGPIVRRRLRRLSTRRSLAALLAASVLTLAPPSFAADSHAAALDVMVSGQGVPVPGIKVTVAPDKGGPPESWNVGDSSPIGVIATDETGHAVFKDVPPGKYIVTTNCGLPGNWIAGNYATRLETLPGRPAHVTLTLRRGGMIRGTALRGTHPAGTAEVRADSPDALLSTCGMMTPTLVDTTDGTFVVAKIPIGATTWVKANLDLGPGQISVWKDFHFDKPETLQTTLEFPAMPESDVGSLQIELKVDGAEAPDSGSANLLQVKADGSWRYEATIGVGGTGGSPVYDHLPAGEYQIRAYAEPGANKWWSAPIDSVTVLPGKLTRYTVNAKLRS